MRVAESSIDILVPEAEPFIGDWYSRTSAAIDGMPPHITLLWPWRPAPLSEADVRAARDVVASLAAFRLTFRSFGRFPGVLYLAP